MTQKKAPFSSPLSSHKLPDFSQNKCKSLEALGSEDKILNCMPLFSFINAFLVRNNGKGQVKPRKSKVFMMNQNFQKTNLKMVKPKILLWLLVVGVVFLDQISKFYALRHFVLFEAIVVNDFWNWYLIYNKGVAFGFLSQWEDSPRYFLIFLTLLIAIWLIVLMNKEKHFHNQMAYSLVIGGALGNLIDRVYHGMVIDFIQWHYQNYYWPSFNLADSAISGGIFLLILFSFQKQK